MSKIVSNIWNIIRQFKYIIVIVVGVALVGFVDEDSIVQRMKYEYQIETLKEEIEEYTEQYEADSRRLKEINRNPNEIAKIARERYFMKADDEDVFVLSDDDNRPTKPETHHEPVK